MQIVSAATSSVTSALMATDTFTLEPIPECQLVSFDLYQGMIEGKWGLDGPKKLLFI